MRNGFFLTLGSLLASASMVLAQEAAPKSFAVPAEKIAASPRPGLASEVRPTDDLWPAHEADCSRFWFESEYLMWWVKDASLPPLTTSVSSADRATAASAGQIPGALGSIGTRVISPESLDFGTISGGRVTAGMFLGQDHTLAVEVSGFLLESRSAGNSAIANVAGTPGGSLLSVPFLDAQNTPPIESIAGVGIPGVANGSLFTTDRMRLWGAEANGLIKLGCGDCSNITALAGLRYIDLTDDLNFGGTSSVPASTEGEEGLFVERNDRFSTRNQFFGGQLGLKGEVHRGQFFAGLTGKIALGDMHENVNVNGTTTISNPGFVFGAPLGLSRSPGGFFAQPSNLGRRSSDTFAVIPEAKLQVGAEVTRNLRVFAGYDFLYVSDVVRAGDQIDRRVNLSQQLGGTLTGPAVPAPRFSSTDFWATGLNFGIALKY